MSRRQGLVGRVVRLLLLGLVLASMVAPWGAGNAAAVSDGTVVAWGDNSYGQL